MMIPTAIELYKELTDEFIMGNIHSKLNRTCKTHDDLVIYAMEKYAKLKIKEFKRETKIKKSKQILNKHK